MKISVVIISKNESDILPSCIRHLSFAHEIVVIDNQSDDNTVEVSKSLGARVYTVSGFDFSYLRNVGKEKAKEGWLLYVDSDERITKELARKIIYTIRHPKGCSAFTVYRENYFFGKLFPKKEKMIRLMKKDSLLGWQGGLHETPIIRGEIGEIHAALKHYTHRELTHMVYKTNEWSGIESQLRYKTGHPQMTWWRFIRVMLSAFFKSYITDEGWRVGTIGFLEASYQAYSMFITYGKLWEKQNPTGKIRL